MILNPVLAVLMIWVSNDGSSYFVLNKLRNQEIILTRIFHSDTLDVGTTLVKLVVFLILQRFAPSLHSTNSIRNHFISLLLLPLMFCTFVLFT